jgi:type II secretory ATPase GspE/PulE/Tfp pilus assembly ATPase PilB-like protein
MGVPRYMVAMSLQAVIAQRLVRMLEMDAALAQAATHADPGDLRPAGGREDARAARWPTTRWHWCGPAAPRWPSRCA